MLVIFEAAEAVILEAAEAVCLLVVSSGSVLLVLKDVEGGMVRPSLSPNVEVDLAEVAKSLSATSQSLFRGTVLSPSPATVPGLSVGTRHVGRVHYGRSGVLVAVGCRPMACRWRRETLVPRLALLVE